MAAFLFTGIAYVVLPLLTLYSCLDAIYLLDIFDPEFISYVISWLPGLFLYYIYISQLIIGQRLPFLDKIWGFPNVVQKHRGFFRYLLIIALLLHAAVRLYEDGIDKVLLHPDLGMLAAYVVVLGSIILMWVALKKWLVTGADKKAADYAKMHKLHQLFYLLAAIIWYHVISAGAFEDNFLGQVLVTGYLVFALVCKLYMIISERKAPIYTLESVEPLHENFVRLRLSAPQDVVLSRWQKKKILALQDHDAGQYAYFSFAEDLPQKNGKKKIYWEQHPFSFAGYAAAEVSESGGSRLTVVAKNLGNFTARLSKLPVHTKVRVQGPYGKFYAEDFPEGTHLIAGGVGITPFISILEQKVHQAFLDEAANAQAAQASSPLTLHWFVREEGELVFGDRFEHFLKHIPNLQIQTYVGQRLSESILHGLLAKPQTSYRELGVMYCGPPAVLPALKRVFANLGIPQKNFHTELFSM